MRGVMTPITHKEMDTERESDLLSVTQGLRGGAGMSHPSPVRSKGPALFFLKMNLFTKQK